MPPSRCTTSAGNANRDASGRSSGGPGRACRFLKLTPRRTRAKVVLGIVGTDTAKGLLFSRLGLSEFGPGYIHFPRDVDDEWFKQLTAEKLMTKHVKGIPTRVWKQIRARNEALDCAVYAFAAYASLNANLERIAQRMEAQVKTPEPSPAQPEQQTISLLYARTSTRATGAANHNPAVSIRSTEAKWWRVCRQVALMPRIPERSTQATRSRGRNRRGSTRLRLDDALCHPWCVEAGP